MAGKTVLIAVFLGTLGLMAWEGQTQTGHSSRPQAESESIERANPYCIGVGYDELLKNPQVSGRGADRLWTLPDGRPLLRLPFESSSAVLITEANRNKFGVRGPITPGLSWTGPPYELKGDQYVSFAPVSSLKTGVVRDRLKKTDSKEYLELQKMVRDMVAKEERLTAFVTSPAELQSIADEALMNYRSDLRNLKPRTALATLFREMKGNPPEPVSDDITDTKSLAYFLHGGLGTSTPEVQIAARVADVTMARVIMQSLDQVPSDCLGSRSDPAKAKANKAYLADFVLRRYRACILSNSLITQKGVEFCMNQELPKISEYLGDLLTQLLLRDTLDKSVPPDYLTPAERVEAVEQARQAFRDCHSANAQSLANEMSLHVSFCVSMSVYPAVRHMVVRALDKQLEPYVPNDPTTQPPNRRRRERIQGVLDSLQDCPALIKSRIQTDRTADSQDYASFLTQYFSMTKRGNEWVVSGNSESSQIISRATAQIKAELTACTGEIVLGAGEIGVESEIGRDDAILAHLKTFSNPEARASEQDRILRLAIEQAYRPCMDRQRGGDALPNPETCKEFVTAKVGADVIEKKLQSELEDNLVKLFPRRALDPGILRALRNKDKLDPSLSKDVLERHQVALEVIEKAEGAFNSCVSATASSMTQKNIVNCMGDTLKNFMPNAAAMMLKFHPDYKIAVNGELQNVLKQSVDRCVNEQLRGVDELGALQAAVEKVAMRCSAMVKRDALVPVALLKAEPIISGVSSDPENTRSMLERYRRHILEPEQRAMIQNLGPQADPQATDRELDQAKESIMWNSYRFVGLNAALDLFKSDDPQYVEELRTLMAREASFGAVRPSPLGVGAVSSRVSSNDIDSLLRNRIATERRLIAPVRSAFSSDAEHLRAQNQFRARAQINQLLERILNSHMSLRQRNFLLYGDEEATSKPLFLPGLMGPLAPNSSDLDFRLSVLERNLSPDVAYEKLKLTAEDLFPTSRFRPTPLGRPLNSDEASRLAGSRQPQEILDSLIDQFMKCKAQAASQKEDAKADCNTLLARGAASRFFKVVASDSLDEALAIPEIAGPETPQMRADRAHITALRRSLERGILRQTDQKIATAKPEQLTELLTDAEIQIVEQVTLSMIFNTLHGQLAIAGDQNLEAQRQQVRKMLGGTRLNPGPSSRFRTCLTRDVKSNLKRPRSEISESTDQCIRFYALGFPKAEGGFDPGFAELAGLKIADSLLVHLSSGDRDKLRAIFRTRLLAQLQTVKDPPRSAGFKDRITGILQGSLLNLALEIGREKSRSDIADQPQNIPVIRGTEALHQLIDSIANGRRHLAGLVTARVSDNPEKVAEFDAKIQAFGQRIQRLSTLQSPPPSVDDLSKLIAQEEFFKDAIRGSVAKTLFDTLTAELIVTPEEAAALSQRVGSPISPTDGSTQGMIRMAVTQIVRPEMLDSRLVGEQGDIVAVIQDRMRRSETYQPEKDPDLKNDLVRSLFRETPIAFRKPDEPALPEELLLRALVRGQFNDTANKQMMITPGQTPGYWGLTGRGIAYWWAQAGAGNRTEINNVLRDSPSGQRAMDLFRRYIVYKTTGRESDRPPEVVISGPTSNADQKAQREMEALTRALTPLLEKGSEELTWGLSTFNASRTDTQLFDYRKTERDKKNAAK